MKKARDNISREVRDPEVIMNGHKLVQSEIATCNSKGIRGLFVIMDDRDYDPPHLILELKKDRREDSLDEGNPRHIKAVF
ncbi:hypothetical protein Q3G72_023232 [Acer saccharum]|nr:hypothetical protein Q3G72_023232 [Acer saccharum]